MSWLVVRGLEGKVWKARSRENGKRQEAEPMVTKGRGTEG